MTISNKLRHKYYEAKANKWYHYFAVFCRLMLALGFIISGFIKVMGERFAIGLPVNNPMGHYLQALYETGYYYTFIGIAQLIIAFLLLIPRTALLGAMLYLPVILNICILTYATRFEGTRITSIMLLANLYLLWWDYDRLKSLLRPKHYNNEPETVKVKTSGKRFPFVFFGSAVVAVVAVIVINMFLYEIRPGNSSLECTNGCKDSKYPKAAAEFCDCVYNKGNPLDSCLKEYNLAKERENDNSLKTNTNQ